MRPLWIVAFVQIALLVSCVPLHAGPIVGSQISGSLKFGTDTINVFDPINKAVPTGFLNKAGTTVTASATQMEFGFADNRTSTYSAEFTDTQLSVTANIISSSNLFTMTFTDDAFLGATLTKTQDTFISAAVKGTTTVTLVGSTITITWPGAQGSHLNGVMENLVLNFNFPAPDPSPISSDPASVPEPGSLALFTIIMAAAVVASRRRSRWAAH